MKDLEKRVSIIEDKLGIVNETLKLKVGEWYKYQDHENWKLCITYIDGNDVGGYGVDLSGGWMRSGKWGVIEDELGKLIKCTPQEIKEALEKEAKRRCLEGEFSIKKPIRNDFSRIVSIGGKYSYNDGSDILFYGGVVIYYKGKWSEKGEQKVDKFAELKEAHRNGAVIQKQVSYGWIDDLNPDWKGYKYRIKTEEKQKTKFHELAYELGITEDYKVDKFVEALTKLSYESGLTLEQDIQQLKEKYKQYKFTITIEDNI